MWSFRHNQSNHSGNVKASAEAGRSHRAINVHQVLIDEAINEYVDKVFADVVRIAKNKPVETTFKFKLTDIPLEVEDNYDVAYRIMIFANENGVEFRSYDDSTQEVTFLKAGPPQVHPDNEELEAIVSTPPEQIQNLSIDD